MASWTTVKGYRMGDNEHTSVHENLRFDIDEFNLYLWRYMTGTRLRIVEYSYPEEIPDPTPSDTYPSYDTSGYRQYAVRFIFFK